MTQPTIELNDMIEFVDDAITWEGSPVINKPMFIAIRAALAQQSGNALPDMPEHFEECISADGLIEGAFTETYYQQLVRVEVRRGYIAVISDGGATDTETRVPFSMIQAAIAAAKDGV